MASNCDTVLVFIGESGSGKSTSINYFGNFFAGTGFTQATGYANVQVVIPNRLFPRAATGYPSNERNINDKTLSQTIQCKEYDFVWSADQNNIRVKVVDTPGLNDTDSRRDDSNIQQILQTICNLPFVTAMIITINGTHSRLSTSVKSTLDQLRSSLPGSVFENLFFIMTNCTENECNFDLRLIGEYAPRNRRVYHMQNSLFSVDNRDTVDKNPKNARRAETNWQDSMETIGELMNEIQQTSAACTQIFTEMRLEREKLIAHKEILIDKQRSLLELSKHLEIERDRLSRAQHDQSANQNYMENKIIERIDIEKKDYYSTICTEHGQVMVCHERCGLSYHSTTSVAHFKNCATADHTGNNCKKCKCGMQNHLHTYEIPVTRMVEIEDIIQSKKAAFDQATQQVQTTADRLRQLNTAARQMHQETEQGKTGILNAIRRLKQICSRFNFAEVMNTTVEKLRQEAKIAQDLNAKKEFNNTADAIERLIQQLK